MGNKSIIENEFSGDTLRLQYDWFYKNFSRLVQDAGRDFFSELFSFKMISLSKNINILAQGEDYFVTKIRIDKQHDVFFRCSEDSIRLVLDKVLGENKKFVLSSISDLEVKIISSFNDYVYQKISQILLPVPPKTQKRKNFDTIHITLFIRDNKSGVGAKMIISVPEVLLSPDLLSKNENLFDISDFNASQLDVNIGVGSTKFSLKEMKSLEKDDIVVFENSDIHSMKLIYGDYIKHFNVSPNPAIITSVNNDDGGNNMEQGSLSQNLWDNIQVEMGAEFEKVKITLGELKSIEKGLVLDLSSVYDNKISLKVENKTIATGELVIINDRYGVRIDEVFASEKNRAEDINHTSDEIIEEQEPQQQFEQPMTEVGDEEFDYSDFELDDQDI